MKLSSKTTVLFDSLALLALSLLTFFFFLHNTTQRFDFFDMSGFMDAGYRLYRGQVPYVDFFFPSPPGQLYFHYFFFKLFGFNLTAIQAHVITISTIMVILTYWICRKWIAPWQATLVSIVTCFSFYGPTSHPWYDQSACFLIVLSIAIWERVRSSNKFQPKKIQKTHWISGILMGLLLVGSILTKVNIGIAALCVLLGTIFVDRNIRRSLLVPLLFGVFLGSGLFYFTAQPSAKEIYIQVMANRPRDRLADFNKLEDAIRTTVFTKIAIAHFALILLGLVTRGTYFLRSFFSYHFLLFGLVATSLFSVWTGSMMHQANITLLGIETAYLVILLNLLLNDKQTRMSLFFKRICLALQVGGLSYLIGLSVYRAYTLTTWTWRASNSDNSYTLQAAPVRGWHCNPAFGKPVDLAIEYIHSNIPKNDSILVFPDATVIYGLTQRESYKHIGFQWFLNIVPWPGRQYNEARNELLNHPPLWIVLHEQEDIPVWSTSKLLDWLNLNSWLKENYREVWRSNDFAILKKEIQSKPLNSSTKTNAYKH